MLEKQKVKIFLKKLKSLVGIILVIGAIAAFLVALRSEHKDVIGSIAFVSLIVGSLICANEICNYWMSQK